jgi:hypothetical protein
MGPRLLVVDFLKQVEQEDYFDYGRTSTPSGFTKDAKDALPAGNTRLLPSAPHRLAAWQKSLLIVRRHPHPGISIFCFRVSKILLSWKNTGFLYAFFCHLLCNIRQSLLLEWR